MTTYEDAIAFVDSRAAWARGYINQQFTGGESARLGLMRMRALLDETGAPDKSLNIIHVAGSKGKGSTAAFAHEILTASGLTCGMFTSPHLMSYRDRMKVGSEWISEADFAQVIAVVRRAVRSLEVARLDLGVCTAFEILICAGMVWFREQRCSVAVVEVGIGGLLDATNVVSPVVSVITHLELEHTAVLGTTIEEIAENKAGIIKFRTPCVAASQSDSAMQIVRERAQTLSAPLFVYGSEILAEHTANGYAVSTSHGSFDELHPRMHGDHQAENMALAIAATAILMESVEGRELPPEAVQAGVRSTWIAGRLDVQVVPGIGTLVLDGAHTVDSMRALADWLRDHREQSEVTIVLGMLNDKDPARVLGSILDLADHVVVVPVSSPRALSAPDLAARIQKLGHECERMRSIQAFLDRQKGKSVSSDQMVVVTGSLILAAEVYRYLG